MDAGLIEIHLPVQTPEMSRLSACPDHFLLMASPLCQSAILPAVLPACSLDFLSTTACLPTPLLVALYQFAMLLVVLPVSF